MPNNVILGPPHETKNYRIWVGAVIDAANLLVRPVNIVRSLRARLDTLVTTTEVKTGKLVTRQPEAIAFATHIPILMTLARIKKIERVLELGTGNFSTLTFLNKVAFPDLKSLKSYENDALWATEMKPRVLHDARAEYIETTKAMADEVAKMDLNAFDLVLVDDSMQSEERQATIREVARRADRAVVVIHDFEHRPYQRAASLFRQRWRFLAFQPNTGIGWNSSDWDKAEFRRMDKAIANFGGAPNNVNHWCGFLDKMIPRV